MSFIDLLLLGSFLLNFLLGLVFLFRKTNDKSLILGLISLSTSLWSLSLFLFRFFGNLQYIEFSGRVAHVLGAFLAPLFVLFSINFTNYKYRSSRILFWVLFLPLVVIIYFLLFTDFIIGRAVISNGIHNQLLGLGYYIYIVYIVFSFNFGFYLLIRRYLSSIAIERLQIKYVFIGTSISALFGVVFDLIYPIFIDYSLNWLGPVSTITMVGSMTYAIAKYRLLNIKFIVAKSILYFLLVAMVTSVFAFTSFFAGELLRESGRYSRLFIFMTVSLLVVVALDPLKRFLAKVTDDIFYKDKINYPEVLRELSIIIAKEIDLEVLLTSLRSALMFDLKLKAIDILVKRNDHFASVTSGKAGKYFAPDSNLIAFLKEKQDIIITDEMYRRTADMQEDDERHRAQEVLDELERQGIEFCVPVYLEGQLKAVIILGQKQSGDVYGNDEIAFFRSLAPQVAVAIEKSQLYESIGEFNLRLQDKINVATRKLKETNAQLQDANAHLKQLDTAKSEFLSIASHQLRTPISALKGYLSMMLEGDFGKVPDKQRQILSDLFESASRLARLINIFLNVSRIESGRFKLDRSIVDVNTLVESVLKELQGQFISKKLTVTFTPAKNMRQLYVDSDKVREVILNLIDNAIKYTPQGSVTITTYEEKNEFHFVCADTGIGIRPDDAKALFRKFVRGTGVAQVNTQGSGLGLYIAQRVVTEHGGRIWVESKGLDKGSSFQFILPIESPDPIAMAKAAVARSAKTPKR